MEDSSTLTLVLIVAGALIGILVTVVALQQRKIKQLERPRYGFLGKPLAVVAGVLVLSGTIGFGVFVSQQDTGTETISADREIRVEVDFVQQAGAEDTYVFRAVPIVDNVAWDNDPALQFDIFWTIENEDEETRELVESRVSQFDPSELTVRLEEGLNTIEARLVINSRVVTEEVQVLVE